MKIDEKTAQLILDAIAWLNRDWYHTVDWELPDPDEELSIDRHDFVRFCKARGIETVERKVEL